MDPKTVMVTFKAEQSLKDALENASANLGMSQSALIRAALDKYINARVRTANNRYLGRATKYLPRDDFEQSIHAVMSGMSLRGLETWSDPDVTPEDVFEGFVKMKLVIGDREPELANA